MSETELKCNSNYDTDIYLPTLFERLLSLIALVKIGALY